jgi:hypothetical protein
MVPTMADEASTIDAALKELASLGRRIAELASTFESRRAGSAPVAGRSADDAVAPVAEGGTAADAVPPGGSQRAAGAAVERPPLPRRRPRTVSGDGSHRASVAAGDDRAPRVTAARTASSRARRQAPPPPRGGRTARRRIVPWPWRGRPTAPMLVSTGLHVAALVVLALVFVAREAPPPPRLSIALPAGEEEPLEDLAEVDIEPLDVEPTEPVDPEAAPEPALPDLAALMPEPLALDAPAAASPQPAVDFPDAAGSGLDLGDLLAVLGDGGGGKGGAEAGGGGGPPPEGTFFGTKGTGRTALFMCDNSASYVDGGFQAVLLELSRAVALMRPGQRFHVVFFSDAAYPLFHPEGVDAFLPATPENKRRLDAWLGTVELCIGGQGIRGAADLALALAPDVVYFLSDGDHAESVIDRMVALPLGDTVVHTFCMQADLRDRRTGLPDPRKLADQQRRNRNLARIAEAHGGTATPVIITPQAALAASVRPVRKNRTRGAVWGLNLPVAP